MKSILFTALACSGLLAADWLTEGGTPSRDNWQQREKSLSAGNVHGLKLLWKRELAETSLTAPVILGPIFTQRGIKELVFVEGSSSTLYAVDADLGRSFWTRKVSVGAPCSEALVTPVISADGRTPLKPVYFAGTDGVVHKVSPTTSEDLETPSGGCGRALEGPAFVRLGTIQFSWKGKDVLLDRSASTWADSNGIRWLYSADTGGLQASQYGDAGLIKKWNAPGFGAPAIANGMLFSLSTRGTVQLNVLDARTGNLLYSSSETLAPAKAVSSVALANGHICFTTSANVLYCFGLPIEI
jgi:hypothetical protein